MVFWPANQRGISTKRTGTPGIDRELLPKIKTFFKASKKCYGSKRIHPLPGQDEGRALS